MNGIYVFLKGSFGSKLFLLLIVFLPSMGYAQSIQFTEDSIPVVNSEVVFVVHFGNELKKDAFFDRAYYYLNNVLDPYSGVFLTNNSDSTVCIITDYLEISSNPIQVFGIYMTYGLQLIYNDGSCILTIGDITFMEKGYFETQEESSRKLDMPEYSGKDIMVDKNYSRLMTRNASARITAVALKRINEIIKSLEISFAQ